MDELKKKLNEISERINRAPLNEEKQNSYTETLFESIKHINEYGNEFWYARELQKALEYNKWRRFEEVIERAKNACKNSGNIISEHFANVGKTITLFSHRKYPDIFYIAAARKGIERILSCGPGRHYSVRHKFLVAGVYVYRPPSLLR